MLIVHGSLRLGGIETFYVRLAKARFDAGLKTKILILTPRSYGNSELVDEAKKYADVFFADDIFNSPKILHKLRIPFHLLYPIKSNAHELFNDVKYIHVGDGFSGHVAIRLLKWCNKELPITIGFYHSLEFCWGGEVIPYFEKQNRFLVFDVISRKNLIIFYEMFYAFYERKLHISMEGANFFPIGVIDNKGFSTDHMLGFGHGTLASPLRICSIGRLTPFKSYNVWMIDLISELKNEGMIVEYHVYGDGVLMPELKEKINGKGLSENIFLHGQIDYSKFSQVLEGADLFVGSGTAIIESAALGIPSIVGIESIVEPVTYGYLSDIPGFSYSENGLYPTKPIKKLILEYILLNESQRHELAELNIKKAKLFSVEKCLENFEEKNYITQKGYSLSFFSRLRYSVSFFWTVLYSKFIRNSDFSTKYSKN